MIICPLVPMSGLFKKTWQNLICENTDQMLRSQAMVVNYCINGESCFFLCHPPLWYHTRKEEGWKPTWCGLRLGDWKFVESKGSQPNSLLISLHQNNAKSKETANLALICSIFFQGLYPVFTLSLWTFAKSYLTTPNFLTLLEF